MSKLESKIRQICNFPSGRAATAIALIAVMATGLAACSATPDEVKPEAIYGPGGAAPTPEGTKGFPELANTPDERPKATSSEDQKAIQDELKKDRATAEDKDSALRAGQAGSVAAKPTPQRQAEIDKAAANADTASIASSVESEKPKSVVAAAAVAAPVAVAAAAPKPAPAPAPAPAPVPVAAAEPAPEPQKVTAAEPAPAPKQELATPYVAPNLPPEPSKSAAAPVAAAGATAGTAALLSKIEEPAAADEMQMASAETNVEPAASPAVAAAPAIVNGIIPMPARGGHKTLAAVMPKELIDETEGTEKAAEPAEAEAAPAVDPDAEAPVTAAPTTKVEVSKPTPAPTAP